MNNLKGSIVAIVTPMQNKSKDLDYVRFKELLAWHLEQKTDAIVIAGSTGEAATLTTEEWRKLLEIGIQTTNNKIPIIAGTGTNCTATTIKKTKLAEEIGVSAALIVTPYYNKPTQEGLKLHFTEIAKATKLPIILYNVPSRTGCDLIPSTVIELAEINNIIGIKDATGDLGRVNIYKQACNPDFILLSGDDLSCVEFMLLGGHGVISVTANIVPAIIHKLCNLIINNHADSDLTLIKQINKQLTDLHKALMIQSNPIPVKWLLAHLGKIEAACRLPLTTLSKEYHMNVMAAYQKSIEFQYQLTEEQ